MTKPDQDIAIREPTRLSRILEGMAGNETTKERAQAAGVSTTTLLDVLSGNYATAPDPSDAAIGKKQLRGYAEALTRLAIYASLDPETTVKEYGLNPGLAVVRDAIRTVQLRQTIKRGLKDPVLEEIAKNKGVVRIGVLGWPPFVDDHEEGKDSWAYDYCKRLIGSMNPRWQKELIPFDSTTKAIGALLATRNRIDLCFGIYDTTYRRLSGLNFVHLPGLGVPLGAIYRAGKPELDWEQLINRRKRQGPIQVVVIREEIGHLFLKGVCDYSEEDLVVVDEGEEGRIEVFAARYVSALVKEGRETVQVAFMADALTCRRVFEVLKSSKAWLDELSSEDSRAQCSEAAGQLLFLGKYESAEDRNLTPPAYRVGIAVPADATRWYELLKSAQIDDMFINAHDLTAELYAQLLMKPLAGYLHDFPFDLDLPREIADKFPGRLYGKLDDFPVPSKSKKKQKEMEERKESAKNRWGTLKKDPSIA